MKFNKCDRCGNFFLSDTSTCPACSKKDNIEMNTLKNYLTTNSNLNDITTNVSALSSETGISEKNLNRFLGNQTFSNGINAIIKENNKNINL